MKRWYYTAEQIGPLYGGAPQWLRTIARTNPTRLPFDSLAHSRSKRIRFPVESFDRWYLSQGGDPSAIERLHAELGDIRKTAETEPSNALA